MKNNLKFYLMSALCCMALVNTQVYSMENQKDNTDQKVPIGLQNIGATCYMNATLQAFAHINHKGFVSPLVNEVKQRNKEFKKAAKTNINVKHLLEFTHIMNVLNSSSDAMTYYDPTAYKEVLSQANPLFEGIAANDSKDLVNFIIMACHEILNQKSHPDSNNNKNIFIYQTNAQEVYNWFLKDFTNNNKSVFSDNFYAINCNETQCQNCKTTIYNYQVYFFLIFPLDEVRKYRDNKNNNMRMNYNMMNYNMMNYNMMNYNMMNYNNNMMMNNLNFNMMNNNMNLNNMNMNNNDNSTTQTPIVTLDDCFDYYSQWNCMSGQNAMFCNHCRINSSAYMRTTLVNAPKTLIILFNRGKGKEFNVNAQLQNTIDLSKYTTNPNSKKYYVAAVICHIGESGMGGHFVCYARDSIDSKWYKYNDAIVSNATDEVPGILNGTNNGITPYLVFYQETPDDEPQNTQNLQQFNQNNNQNVINTNNQHSNDQQQHDLNNPNSNSVIKNSTDIQITTSIDDIERYIDNNKNKKQETIFNPQNKFLDLFNYNDLYIIKETNMEIIRDRLTLLLRNTALFLHDYAIRNNKLIVDRINQVWSDILHHMNSIAAYELLPYVNDVYYTLLPKYGINPDDNINQINNNNNINQINDNNMKVNNNNNNTRHNNNFKMNWKDRIAQNQIHNNVFKNNIKPVKNYTQIIKKAEEITINTGAKMIDEYITNYITKHSAERANNLIDEQYQNTIMGRLCENVINPLDNNTLSVLECEKVCNYLIQHTVRLIRDYEPKNNNTNNYSLYQDTIILWKRVLNYIQKQIMMYNGNGQHSYSNIEEKMLQLQAIFHKKYWFFETK